MSDKISRFLKSEMSTSVFYILLGLCLIAVPVQTVNVICKIIFGLALIVSGGYQLYTFLKGKEDATVLNMFSGVIVLVFGVFLFSNPQIVVRLLPVLIGALLLVDSIWLLRTGFLLKKRNVNLWTAYIAGAAAGIILAGIIMLNPFSKLRTTILFSGIVLLINGIADVVFYMLRKKNLTSDPEAAADQGTDASDDKDMYDEYDPSYKKDTEEHHHFGNPVVEEELHFGNPPEPDTASAWNSSEGRSGNGAFAPESKDNDPAGIPSAGTSVKEDSSQNHSAAPSDSSEAEPKIDESRDDGKKEDGFERPGESEWKF